MDFKQAAQLGQYIAKDYSEEVFKLLMSYRDISASEAASRLNMHIRTIQEYLEVMTSYGILEKEEVIEGKRPYYRYSLREKNIIININLEEVFAEVEAEQPSEERIREMKNSGAKFSMARKGDWFSTLTVWKGEGRKGSSRRISLTTSQGKFLYNLPFPDAKALTIEEILVKAGLENSYRSEIENIVKELIEMGVVERVSE